MSRTFATACALGALLVAGPSLAQSGDQPATDTQTMQSLPPAPQTQGGQTEGTAAGRIDPDAVEVETVEVEGSGPELEGGFIARQGQNHLMASELMDAEVMTSGDESLGKVEDMLLDAEGRVVGVVVGVGGFLGIGQKQVAIPTQSLQVVYEAEAREGTDGPAGAEPRGVGQGLALTGGTDIAHIVVDFSRDELEQAPDYAELDEQESQAQAEGEPVEAEPVEATGATGRTLPPPPSDAPQSPEGQPAQ